MILVRYRCAEQRHDAVAHDFVDRALVAMHGIHHHADCPVEMWPASSGSLLSMISSEPLMSANSTVMCLRSPVSQRPGINDALGEVAPVCRFQRGARARSSCACFGAQRIEFRRSRLAASYGGPGTRCRVP